METYQFEPGEHNEQNQAEMENISENTEQASLPGTLSVAALEYESGLGPSDWALEMPPTDTWFPDRDPSFLGPLDMAHSISSANTRNSVKLTSDASVIVPYSLFQYDGPLTTSKSMLLSESETTGTSRSSMTKGQGDVALAASSYDYDIMHNGLDSETGQQFLNECSFKNQHRKPETLQLSASFESKPSVISQRDWETHRDVIIKLYSDEQKTLKEIMDIMKKQYRFTPSEKQYKAKLKDWKVVKYVPNAMAQWMARKAETRKLQGKPNTAFKFKNQFLTEERVKRLARDSKGTVIDSATPDEINYFTPAITRNKSSIAFAKQDAGSCANSFEDFTQEDPFAGAILTSIEDDETAKAVVTTGLVCELKTYEVRYNSSGLQSTILIEGPRSWSIQKDLDLDSALIFTRFYTREQAIERTELLIQSPYLVSALQEVITKYPGVNIQSKAIVIRDLPECIFHYRTELQRYGARLLDLAPQKHLSLLLQHSFSVLKLQLNRYYGAMIFSNSPGLNFEDLWMAFRPGDLLFHNIDGNTGASRLVSMRKSSNQQWLLTTLIASFDGTNFGYEQRSFEIHLFEGYLSLEELPIFPLEYHSYSGDMKASLEQRGRKYVSLFGSHFKKYTGIAKKAPPPDLDLSACDSSWSRWKDVSVDSRIMIDFQVFNWNNPSCRTVLSKIITSAGEAQIGLISDDYVICNNWIPGFALSHKKWYLFNIDLLEEIEFHATAFESLVLAPERKEFLLSLVEHHIKPKNTHELDDIIEGKGRGLNILLSGAPGLGKTLTAETIAEHIRRPLLALSSGDVGLEPESAEKALGRYFASAEKWGAVMLLDEADIFLAKRSHDELRRNAMVSMFLRLLENHSGILFLTTNRLSSIDPAFQSRMQATLHYEPFSPETSAQIWDSVIDKAVGGHPSWLDTRALQKLTSRDLNGREIRNVVLLASMIAKHKGHTLGMKEIEDVIINVGDSRKWVTSGISLDGLCKGTKRESQEALGSVAADALEPKKRRLDLIEKQLRQQS